MAILASEILTFVNNQLRRSETDIDTNLKNALRRISTSGDYLFGQETQTITQGDNILTFPEDYKTVTNIRLTSVTDDPSIGTSDDKKTPLNLIGWDAYLTKIGHSEGEGEPDSYSIFNDNIYLYPIANTSYNVDIYFTKYHAYSTDIEYSEKFREVIESLTTLNVAKSFGLMESISVWSPVSFGNLNSLKDTEHQTTKITKPFYI